MSDLNINNFEQEVLKSDKPVLVRFGVDTGCGYCDKYKPVERDALIASLKNRK